LAPLLPSFLPASPPASALFPYTTLFRSPGDADLGHQARRRLLDRRRTDSHRAPALQRLLGDLTLGRREADQQHARPGQLAGALSLALGLLVELDLEPEGRAEPDGALQADLALHEIDELLGDGRAEARPTEAARRG